MQVIRAEKGGFCFGVRRAVDIATRCAQGEEPVYTLGPIIHNEKVVDRLKGMGIHAAASLEEIPSGSRVVIRSHGVPQQVLQQAEALGLQVTDATCPCVARIQQKVHQCHEQGIPVVIIGERAHPEVTGINGWCGNAAHVVHSAEDVQALPRMETACIVAQTTTQRELWQQLLALLEAKIAQPEVYPSICNATAERQREAAELAARVECAVVVGGRDSSNTRKLFEICRQACPATWCVEDADGLPMDEIRKYKSIGIISGASTPDWIIEEVCAKMSDININAGNEEAEVLSKGEEEVQPVAADVTAAEPVVAAEEAPQAEVAPAVEAAPAEPKNPFEEAFEKTMKPVRSGQVINGVVVQVTADEVCVNIGYKADGIITKDEYSSDGNADLLAEVHEGDEMEVEILKINDGEGNVLLSRKNLEVKRGWKMIMDDFEAGNFIKGVGKQVVKGGLIAQVYGVRAFIPASQLDSRYVEDISEYINKEMDLKILEVEKHRHRVVASRKAVLDAEKLNRESAVWELLKSHEGDIAQGVVRRLTDFGAFVEVEGVDGLVHVTDLAWGRVKHPRDVVAIGDVVSVVILKVDIERKRLSLSAKMAKPRPWDIAPEKYHVGDVVEGRVVRLVSFGAFVELEPGLDGLVHISQVANHRVEKVEDVLHIEDVVMVKVLDVNPAEKRISLSIREAMIHPDDTELPEGVFEDDGGRVYSTEDGYNRYAEEDAGEEQE